ncbi:MAG TPA: YegS/Rv2252/BmrU family lipid kinase [Bacteroidia bacterium]|nr:YegS/Rv2252/BmrU family lipid kinase [Bacteroidia bacterium]
MNIKKKICFIINPISGIGRQKTVEKLIDKLLDTSAFDHQLAYTEAPKHATLLATKAAREGFDIVVAVGGDGSVNEVAKGLINSQTAMGILPAGSGNGLARHLGIPMNLQKAISVLQTGKTERIDSIQFNEDFFVNVAGIGFDAHIGWQFSTYGKRGFSSYLKVIIRELLAFKTHPFELVIDGNLFHKNAYLVSFANGSQWGNNAFIAPTADIRDGIMDVVILKKFSSWMAIPIGFKLFSKKIHTVAAVELFKAKEVIVKQKSTIAHLDGEPVQCGQTIVVKVNPLSLNVIVPL